ncbi:MAG: hypothetical protein KatS3mg043_0091 [Rhodothermaceae bacterium]|nr:MAG: hypothetical protein KatS3mg043_0091 [Rhodothermaceae bacterium]
MHDETISIHGGWEHDQATNAIAVPIYQTVAYAFDDAAHGAALFNLEVPGNIYTRIMNPTQAVLEERVAQLEHGVAALATSAGSAAINYAILTIAEAGSNIVTVPLLYGGTYTLFAGMLPKQGIEVRFADDDRPESLERLIDEKTAAVYCESIGNPAGNIVDLEALAAMAHRNGVPLIVDNTVATPVLIKPIDYGADIVVHSLTKYMGGHGTSLGGVIVDGGTFPWADHADRYPMLTRPEPAYHGVVYTEAFGPAAYIARARTVPLRNTGSAISPVQRLPDPAGPRDAAAAHGAPRRQRAGRGPLSQRPPGRSLGAVRRPAGLALLRTGEKVHERPPLGPALLRGERRLRSRRQVL